MSALVLASGSASRRSVLEAAGIDVLIDPPDIDETAIKTECQARGFGIRKTAATLAAAKAARIDGRYPGHYVLAADQMLECDGEWFDKPADRAAAAAQVARLAGRTHLLVTAAVLARNGQICWRSTTTAALTMRPLSSRFIAEYLDRVGDRALLSVGAYQVEGLGIQLFSRIRGDHFTILGLPLLPLLAFLRGVGAVAS